jgi:hypothetical protein
VKHQQRGFNRGFARRPRVPTDMAYTEDAAHWAYYDNTGSPLPPPPPPPVVVELNRQQNRRDWNVLGDEESLETEVAPRLLLANPRMWITLPLSIRPCRLTNYTARSLG